LGRKGRFLVVNSNDRVVRLFEAVAKEAGSPADCTPVVRNVAAMAAVPAQGSLLGGGALLRLHREFQNAEQKIQWRAAALTCDNAHLAAACLSKTDHHIYIYNRDTASAERILEGESPFLPYQLKVSPNCFADAENIMARRYTLS
jgi:hypothetical protein